MSDIRPLIAESSTAESTTVQVVLGDLKEKTLTIPDYQRDSDQWDITTKSLFIESIINNLTIPAFFFEVSLNDGIENNEVVDGQQRLTTLDDYYQGNFPLVPADDAPYISPNSVHYATKKFKDLPKQYQQAFLKYRLSIIKLRNLGDMKLEIFRRINQGGTPLSGQDIRLAYYGDTSKSVVFIRLVGIFDKERVSSKRSIETAKTKYGLEYPWDEKNLKFWNEWWKNKDISHGQVPSEMFLWSLVSVCYSELNNLLQDTKTLNLINCRYHGTIDEALDAFCGYLKFQDNNPQNPKLLISFEEMSGDYIDFFKNGFNDIVLNGSSLPITKYRLIAAIIGNLFKMKIKFEQLSHKEKTDVIEFIRKPQDTAKILGKTFHSGKGRWGGNGGYNRQFDIVKEISEELIK